MTQKQRVIHKLKIDGRISRNQCLNNYISRLSAIILDLRNEGWDFETKDINGDYVYIVTKSPLKEITYKLSDGREIKTYA